ncbi:MAG TPA: SsrA-binding protein SmpB [Melioribacteraceae bacterium]|nr:SsrA-binding protein SmpB [Melioribacteraceae bacterium]
MNDKPVFKDIIQNKKARHDYNIIVTYEAGIELVGTEVKSLRDKNANLTDSYAQIKEGEVWLVNSHIGIYKHGNINNHDPLRKRRLLLHKSEIRKLIRYQKEKGYTLIALKFYFKNGKVKVELAVAKGKKEYDKRETLAKKQADIDINRHKNKYRD